MPSWREMSQRAGRVITARHQQLVFTFMIATQFCKEPTVCCTVHCIFGTRPPPKGPIELVWARTSRDVFFHWRRELHQPPRCGAGRAALQAMVGVRETERGGVPTGTQRHRQGGAKKARVSVRVTASKPIPVGCVEHTAEKAKH